MNCLTIDEMSKLAFAHEITDELRIFNVHLIQCDKCADAYDDILLLADIISDISLPGMRIQRNEIRFLKALLPLEKVKDTVSGAAKFLDRININALAFNLKNTGKAILEDTKNFLTVSPKYNFAYPASTVRGGEDEQNEIVDKRDKNNKISVSDGGVLCVELNLSADVPPPMVAVLSAENEVSVYEMTYDESSNIWRLDVGNLKSGEYSIIITE